MLLLSGVRDSQKKDRGTRQKFEKKRPIIIIMSGSPACNFLGNPTVYILIVLHHRAQCHDLSGTFSHFAVLNLKAN